MEAIFLNSDSERDENNSDSNSESCSSDEDVTSETGHEAECAESSHEIESEMELSADEENLPQRNRRAAAHGPETQWEIYEDINPFESTWLPKFTESPGILAEATEFSPVDFSYIIFPDEAFTVISNETNRYAGQCLDTPVEPSSRFHAWNDTSPNEIRAFVALEIAMGLCQKPAHSDYWSGFWLTAVPFSFVMSRNRFELLQTFVHFSNVEEQVRRGEMVTTLYLRYRVF